jgi:hypothetical protein
MIDPCLSCRVPDGCDEGHPLCGYQDRAAGLKKARDARWRETNPLSKIMCEIRYLSAVRVERAYLRVVDAA